ncbi:MAG: tyrosine-type recombinase/integrase [Planctomycetes bacterium]|nr:tyrosine-type recombinase/integrase [Planctomycetota bacterium]
MPRWWPFGKEATGLTLKEALDLYFEYAVGLAPRTQRNMRSRISQWEKRGGEMRVARITERDFRRFRERCLAEGLRAYTIEVTLNAVYTVLRHCGPASIAPHGRGILKTIPAKGRRLKIAFAQKPTPSLADLSRVYELADMAWYPQTHLAPEVWVRGLLVIAYNTALRLSDLLRLRWEHVRLSDQAIKLAAKKTGKEQWLPINATLARHLEALRGGDERVLPLDCQQFDHLRRQLYTICDAAGVERFAPQGIRRRSATEYERVSPGAGGLILGHTLRSMTFAHYVQSLDVLQPAADKLPQPEAFLKKP